jgi:hypothetical protein
MLKGIKREGPEWDPFSTNGFNANLATFRTLTKWREYYFVLIRHLKETQASYVMNTIRKKYFKNNNRFSLQTGRKNLLSSKIWKIDHNLTKFSVSAA